ncbi:MAG: AAA family ATPase [Lachnospiraceae bacterium]|nr:AAA family ATPase [Lachnospiraceae bacterium]
MGTYLNPGNSGFERIRNGEYIDKTGMIGLLNGTINTTRNLTCVSRPRRFGKSYAAQMLCAYYDKTCESEELFDGLKISETPEYRKHLNRYDVIYLDMTQVIGECGREGIVSYIKQTVSDEISQTYPSVQIDPAFSTTLINMTAHTGNKIVMIIDEWDAPIREMPESEREYLEFLRMLFKSSGTTARIFAAGYMTGIFPIKKNKSQSAISDFQEYTMIKPRIFGTYVGFTEEEVKCLCEKHRLDFEMMRQWYDGYSFPYVGSVYNPNSVMSAVHERDFDTYWTKTSAVESLMEYIEMDYRGLQKTIAELIGGIEVGVDADLLSNDVFAIRSAEDVLTRLAHLGYLALDLEKSTLRIPNEEIRREFIKTVRSSDHGETVKRLQECDRLFLDTIEMNEENVAAQIEKVHAEETSPLHYNKEDSLRSVIKLAYYTYRDHYTQWEELPSGEGYADVVYLPKKDSDWPVLVVELKWNQSAEGAISQILRRKYPDSLKGYGSRILLVGIAYNKEDTPGARKHTCRIMRVSGE